MLPAPNRLAPPRDMKYSVELVNGPAPVPLVVFVYVTGWPSTYGMICWLAGAEESSTNVYWCHAPALGRAKNAVFRESPMPIATPKLPLFCGAFGSMRKPPALSLKFEVNSIARRSSSAYAFHFIQNSTVTLLVPERSTFADAESSMP